MFQISVRSMTFNLKQLVSFYVKINWPMKIYLVTNQMKFRFIFCVTLVTSKRFIQNFSIIAFFFHHHRHFQQILFLKFQIRFWHRHFNQLEIDCLFAARGRLFCLLSVCLLLGQSGQSWARKLRTFFCNGTIWNEALRNLEICSAPAPAAGEENSDFCETK